jgi:PKD domain-containing protein
VNIFARSLRRLALVVRKDSRGAILTLAGCLSLLLMAVPAPAGAIVGPVEVKPGESRKFGIEPHATEADLLIPSLAPLQYGGGPVMHTNNTYAIYWDPAVLRAGDPGRPGKYHGDWQQLINGFLEGFAAESGTLGNVFSLTPQYTEAGGAEAGYASTFRGGIVDTASYPSDGCTDPDHSLNQNFACLTDEQLRREMVRFIEAHKLDAGSETIFYLFTPPGVTVCLDSGTATGHCSDNSATNPWTSGSGEETTSYTNSFCSYHSVTATAASTPVLYAAIPWPAGEVERLSDCQDGTAKPEEPNQHGLGVDGTYDSALPDLLINQIAAQEVATVTDPKLNAWTEPLTGYEVPDQCRNWFELPPVVQGSNAPDEHTHAGSFSNQDIRGAGYYLNTEFNQAALYYDYPGIPCELNNNLEAKFTPPTPVSAGNTVTFDGAESDVTLEQSADPTTTSQPLHRATFTWNFGDGSGASGPGYSETNPAVPLYASVEHSYEFGGTYDVTLTITDVAGNVTRVQHAITVSGNPASGNPSTPSNPGTASASGTPSSTGAVQNAQPSSSAVKAASPQAPVPAPVASAAIVSRTLKAVTHSGLLVRYSVNEQVAGRLEVLLERSLARRLGIGGAAATGLPAGSPAKLVIAKAILVTTAGGRSTVKILLSKSTAARLARLHKVALTLRLVVRNAASQGPATTTALSVVTLTR